jgi:hypothetical protein
MILFGPVFCVERVRISLMTDAFSSDLSVLNATTANSMHKM